MTRVKPTLLLLNNAYCPSVGGVENSIRHIAGEACGSGWRVVVVASDLGVASTQRSNKVSQCEVDGLTLYRYPLQPYSGLGVLNVPLSAEGTWTKRMHPGWAASAGIKSAVMAKAGFQGPRTVFEGTHGLFKGFSSDTITPDFSHLESFGGTWISAGLAFKPYTCGTMTQPFVDCALQAAKKLRLEEIEGIHAHVGEGTVHRLWEPLEEKRNPSTPYGAKFSVPYCIAIGLLDGKAGLNEFTEEQLSRNDIQSVTSKITYSINPEDPYPKDYVGWIDVIDIHGNTRPSLHFVK